jgi:glycerophosphoryl diester phosphodiesterase
MSANTFTVIAHRGASAYAPENTFAAFDMALDMGCHHIELDVRLTSDNHVVVRHNETVDSTTNGSGRVDELLLEDVKKLDAGSWKDARFAGEPIPTLEEVLGRYRGRAHLHIELKDGHPGLAEKTAKLVQKYQTEGSVTIISFASEMLKTVGEVAPSLARGWLVRDLDDETIAEAVSMNVAQISPPAKSLTPELVRLLHKKGLSVRAWSVHLEEDAVHVIKCGADGMTVDWPDRAKALVENQTTG